MRREVLMLALTVLLAVPAEATVAVVQEDPAGVVMKVTGDVRVRSGAAEPAPATVGLSLRIGDEVIPAAGAEAIVMTRSGQKQTVTEAVTVAAREEAELGDMFTRSVNVIAQAATSNARSVPNRQGMVRPIPGEPVPVSPRNGIVTLTTRPTLTWFAIEGAQGYTVQLRREGGGPPMRFESADTVFTVPEELEPGTWHWTVGAGRRVAREATFEVASADQRRMVEQAMAAISEMGFDPDDDGRLLALVTYIDLGMHYEALGVIEGMESAGAPLGPDALLLKGEVLDALGRIDEARAAFDRADALLGG